jgi:hypothetical protein
VKRQTVGGILHLRGALAQNARCFSVLSNCTTTARSSPRFSGNIFLSCWISHNGMMRNRLPSDQFVPLLTPQRRVTPEKRLMFAILQDAVACLQKGFFPQSRRCSRPAHEAAQWVAQRGCTWLFSFESICDNLNLDAEALRQQLLQKTWPRSMARRRSK